MCPAGMVWDVGDTEILKSPALSVAEAVLPVPPLVELTLPVVLSLEPEVVGVTFTLTAHEPLAAIVPPLKLMVVSPAAGANVPPHVLLEPGTAATCRPAGKVSLTATPFKAVPVLELVMVNVKLVVPLTGTLAAPKALLIEGGATTVRPADAVLPVPPLLEVTLPLVLVYCPDVAPVTVTLNWHWLLVLMPAPDNVIPVGAVVVSVPPQTVAELFATVKPVGSVSLNPTPVSATGFAAGLVAVNVRDVVPLRAIVEGLNSFAIEGGPSTASVALLLVAPAPVSFELTAPVVLLFSPTLVPVTFKLTVHEAPAPNVPLLRLKVPLPAVAPVKLPPQRLFALGTAATVKPAGRVSLTERPVRPTLELGLVIVNVRLVDPLSGIVAAPKALVMVGGVATLRFAEAVLPVPPLVEVTLPLVLVYCPAAAPITVTLNWHWLLVLMFAPDNAMPVGLVVVNVPPHTGAVPLATVRPAGNVSLNATPASATALAAGLVMVNVRDVVALRAIDEGLNALAIEGGATTARVAVLLVVPVPPSVELIAPVVLDLVPALVPVTSAEKVHDDPAAGDAVRVPPDRLIMPLPATAVIVPLPQVPVTLGVAATATPAGRVSVKATPLRALAVLGLVMVKLSVLLAFSAMLVGLKALLMVGGATTVKLAVLLVAPAPDSVELMAPVVLDLVPALVPVTFTVMEHEPLDASVPPVKLMLLEPAVYDGVPLHVLLGTFGVATTKPAGRVSVKATPVSPKPELGLLMLNVKLVVPLSGMLATPNALLMVGGLATMSVAVLLVAPVPPFVELITPVVLLTTPLRVPVTLKEIVQELLTGIPPPLRESEVLPAVAPVKVPPQVLLNPGVPATCRPPVSVSLKATPDSATVLAEGLVSVKVRVVVPPTGMLVAPNALLIVGGATTITVLLHELLLSLNSITSLLGSTAQTPPVGLT